ncbi:MAG: FHA domain-containing protein [Myxococcota bacterium]
MSDGDPPVSATATVPLGDLPTSSARALVVIAHGATHRHPLPESGTAVVGRDATCDVRIEAPGVSRRHASLSIEQAVHLTDLGSSNGTKVSGRVLKPGQACLLQDGDVLELGECVAVVHGGVQSAPELAGRAHARAVASRVAKLDLPVLVVGPDGVGKSALAQRIYAESPRKKKPLVEVGCPRLSATAVERVAATSDKATILLRQIDATPARLQASLASALADSGARVLATTRVDPELSAQRMRLYEQLLTRVRGVEIRLPPLSETVDELEALVAELVRDAGRSLGLRKVPKLAAEACAPLAARAWPGNVRELRRVVERSVAACARPMLEHTDWLIDGPNALDPDVIERTRIEDALAACAGNQTKAARMLKISRRTLVSRLDRYKIARPRK